MNHRLTSATALVAALSCFAPAHAIVNGTATTGFDAVGTLGSTSGVLVADNWVLTAAHVANSLMVGNAFESGGGSSVIDAIYTYSSAGFPNDDIALLHLSTAPGIAKPILNDQVVLAQDVGMLGALTMVSAQNQSPRGYAATTASSVETIRIEGSDTWTVNWLITHGPAHVEQGDSGSALFKGQVSDSAGSVLLGIASATLSDDPTGVSQDSAYVQVASYKAWIDATVGTSGQHVTWASTVPEPSSLLLLLTGAWAMWAFRPGHFGRNG